MSRGGKKWLKCLYRICESREKENGQKSGFDKEIAGLLPLIRIK